SGGLRMLPSAAFCRTEHGVDDRHVGDGIFEWDRSRGAIENRAREGVDFHGILVDLVIGNRLNARTEHVATVVEEDAARAIGGGVVGDLDLDTAARAENLCP